MSTAGDVELPDETRPANDLPTAINSDSLYTEVELQ